MQRVFGYCRISTAKQNIERQERNILAAYPEAKIYKERYTGTKVQGRRELDKILRLVQSGDTIVFDSVSRMSRNASEGIELYMMLYDKGVELVFLKEPHINTETYKQALNNSVELVGNEIADIYIEATNKVLRLLATRQIELAFGQAQKEVDDLHKRTSEGIETARRNGKQIGTPKGAKLNVKKKAPAMSFIAKHSREFGGELNDTQCAAAAKISRKTFYKYKEELIVQELFRNVPFVNESNYREVFIAEGEYIDAYWKEVQACVKVLKQKWGELVDGFWFIREPADDGGTQYIFRTNREITGVEDMKISGDICPFTGHEMLYALTHSTVKGASVDTLKEAVEDGVIFAIFDTEREG